MLYEKDDVVTDIAPGLGHGRLADLDPLLLGRDDAALLSVQEQRQPGTLSPRSVWSCHDVLEHGLAGAGQRRLLAHDQAVGPPVHWLRQPVARCRR